MNLKQARWLPWILIGTAVAVSTTSVILPSIREATPLELALLQAASLALGLVGSYVVGKQSARDAAAKLIQPHARSAFRRLLSLYGSLSRLGQAVAGYRAVPPQSAGRSLEVVEAIIAEQIAAAGDALEDWRDVVPSDVAELEARLRSQTMNVQGDNDV